MSGELIKNKNSLFIGTIVLVTSIILFVISINMYFNLSKPQFYKSFIELGNKFLNEAKYEEAILEFKKAIHIEPKSIEARIGNGKSYIGLNKVDNAVEEFKEAQNIDIENTKLLLEILTILNNIDSESAYDILQNYIDKTKNPIPDNLKDIINNSNEKPNNPVVNLKPGIYINQINIKLELNKLIVGNTFYYTFDGSEPTKESIKYSGNINIKEDSVIKIIAYNHKGESSEIITLEYFIDYEMMDKIDKLIKESEELIKNTEEGTNIGNCVKGSKKKFKDIIDSIKESLSKDAITYENANKMYEKLNRGLEDFKYNIIEKTNKSKLKEIISKAQSIHDKAIEGKKGGQYKSGSKSKLLSAIKECKNIHDNILSKQKDIDNGVTILNKAINTFESSKVANFNKSIAIQYAINKYGKPIKHSEYLELGKNCSLAPETIHWREYSIYADSYFETSGEMLQKNGLKYYEVIMYTCYCFELDGEGHGVGGVDIIHVYENGHTEYRDDYGIAI